MSTYSLKLITYLLVIFQGLDVILTTYSLTALNDIQEANPLMKSLIDIHFGVFALGKFALTFPLIYLVWNFRDMKLAQFGILLLFVVYANVIFHHISLICARV